MKRKVFLFLVIAVAVLAAAVFSLPRVAENRLRAALTEIPSATIDFKKVRLSLIAGNLELKDVDIVLRDSTNASLDIEGRIKAVRLERLRWSSLLRGEACAKRLLIREPVARLVLPGKTQAVKDTAQQSPGTSFLKKVSLSELRVEKGKIGLEGRDDSMKASAQGIALSVRDIGIQLAEKILAFNDSCYFVALDSLDFIDAAGLSRIRIDHLATADAGPVEAQSMHLYNCVPQEKLAERMGKVAAMWYDVKLDSLYSSSLNIPRMIKDERVDIDSIHLSGPEIVILQDDRYPPRVPYPTFQEGLNQVKIPLQIDHIDARINAFTFIWETTHVNRGTFPMRNVHLAVSSVSNAPGNMMQMDIKAGRKGHSHLDMALSIRNDKPESTHGKMLIYGLEASRLDSFARPLFGATAKADIHQIDCNFKGDKHRMSADFCMLYDSLTVQAWNDSSAPIRFVAKNSGAISFLANLFIPDANPSHPGKEPKRVEYTFERNPMLPYPAYLIKNLTNGMLQTILPGGSVHKPTQ